jgi:Protein of unknown function (DUF2795)
LNNQEINKDIQESLQEVSPSSTTKYICKVCGGTFNESNELDSHIAEVHHPKRTVTLNDIINSVFKGEMNFPKTKAEILKYIESNKDDPSITPQVLDTLRKLSDKRYETEAELAFELNQIK